MILEVKDITKKFGDNEVLHGVSFQVESGKALGLLGRNGAGKTTTIRIIMDVFRANSGELYLDGRKFNQKDVQIGYLPEERGLYPKKTCLEQLVYLGRIRGVSKQTATANAKKWLKRLEVSEYENRKLELYPKKTCLEQLVYLGRIRGVSKQTATANAKKWLKRLEVSEYENRKLETLSKGNQQKVQLASTLVCDPDIVILDEPFSGLDPVNSRILQDVVRELINDNKIVIFSSHQMSYVEEFCEDIAIINKGEVVLSGNLNEIKTRFGENQLVISARNLNRDELENLVNKSLSDIINVTGQTKEEIIVRANSGVARKNILNRLLELDVDIERFETYKPSLNDIFVSQVGEE